MGVTALAPLKAASAGHSAFHRVVFSPCLAAFHFFSTEKYKYSARPTEFTC